jgi:hypothetical protein
MATGNESIGFYLSVARRGSPRGYFSRVFMAVVSENFPEKSYVER